MLSKTELEFLKFPEKFSADYACVLSHRIKAKSVQLRSKFLLLGGSLGVMEFSNGQQSLNQSFLGEVLVLRPGFGPGSATREAAILDRTILPERIF